MLAGFGLTVSEDHFLDSAMEVIELPREVNLGGLRVQTREPVRVPIQIRVTESQMNRRLADGQPHRLAVLPVGHAGHRPTRQSCRRRGLKAHRRS